jgi:hypothetical protein
LVATLSAFSNTKGGQLIVRAIGEGLDSMEQVTRRVKRLIGRVELQFDRIAPELVYETIQVASRRHFLWISVSPGDRGLARLVDGSWFVRSGTENVRCGDSADEGRSSMVERSAESEGSGQTLSVDEEAHEVRFGSRVAGQLPPTPWRFFLCLYKSWLKKSDRWVTYAEISDYVWKSDATSDECIQHHKLTLTRWLQVFEDHVVIEKKIGHYRLRCK